MTLNTRECYNPMPEVILCNADVVVQTQKPRDEYNFDSKYTIYDEKTDKWAYEKLPPDFVYNKTLDKWVSNSSDFKDKWVWYSNPNDIVYENDAYKIETEKVANLPWEIVTSHTPNL